MNLGLIIVAIVIVAAGAFGSRVFISKNTPEPEVLSVTEPTASPVPITSPEPTATVKPLPTAPSATPGASPAAVNSSEWAYPGAHIESDGVMSSTDSTDTVTDWYKAKITEGNYNIRNFVKTSANNTVKNVLQAVRGSESIKIEITKNPEDSFCRIRVN